MSNPIIPFEPLFYLMDLDKNQLRSIAVEKLKDGIYEGLCFKEWATGWEINPISIGKIFISRTHFDFTTSFEEAVKHASINNQS